MILECEILPNSSFKVDNIQLLAKRLLLTEFSGTVAIEMIWNW